MLGNRLLVWEIKPWSDADRAAESNIVIPEAYAEAHEPYPTTGIVIKVSDEWRGPKGMLGKMVMFGPYAGEGCKFSDKNQFRVLDEAQILCTVMSNTDRPLSEIIGPEIKDKLGIDILKDAA